LPDMVSEYQVCGTDVGIRTQDLSFTKQMLYH